MEDELKKLAQAGLAGIQTGDTNAGTGNDIVNNFTRANFGDILAKQSSGIGTFASTVADQQAKEAEAARQAELQRLKEKLNPDNYKMVKKEDGGFDFFDPDGNAIDVKKFADVNGTTPAKILANSDNPFDQQYVNDYNNTKDLITAIQNGDNETVAKFRASNEQIGTMKPEDIMRELIKKYPHIYGKGNYSSSYASNNAPLLTLPTTAVGGTTTSSTTSGIGVNDFGY